MNILVTAGNTQTPIDKVRCLTNIFTGKTGTRIALEAVNCGHGVTLLTSHPEIVPELASDVPPNRLQVRPYRTFDDLSSLMESTVPTGEFDAIVHAAAVSDYSLGGVYARRDGGELVDVAAGKVKSSHAELWLKLEPTPKLVDRIRQPWGFTGTLVKFKLEVGLSDAELLAVAEKSRVQSTADFMVANTLEGRNEFAFVGPVAGKYVRITRAELPGRLIELLER
jgi:phosphopantothenate-cysteine ligase/phosphopantothenoylcysteine decarboxylase/phosphopantothenate--cysteine ligase